MEITLIHCHPKINTGIKKNIKEYDVNPIFYPLCSKQYIAIQLLYQNIPYKAQTPPATKILSNIGYRNHSYNKIQ